MFTATVAPKPMMIPCEKIFPNPLQPRRSFDAGELENLSASIKEYGLLQPISVRKHGERYELIAGERRLRATKLAGISKIACFVLEADAQKSGVLAMVENLQRSDLNFFEEAEALAVLSMNFSITQVRLAAMLGKSQSTIANKLRLLDIAPQLREKMTAAGLTERHARALLPLSAGVRDEACDRVIKNGLNVAQTEKLVVELLKEALQQKPKRKMKGAVRDLRIFENTLHKAVSSLKLCGLISDIGRVEVSDGVEYTIKICTAR